MFVTRVYLQKSETVTNSVDEIDDDGELLMSQMQVLPHALPWKRRRWGLLRRRRTLLLLLTGVFSLHRPCEVDSPSQVHSLLIIS